MEEQKQEAKVTLKVQDMQKAVESFQVFLRLPNVTKIRSDLFAENPEKGAEFEYVLDFAATALKAFDKREIFSFQPNQLPQAVQPTNLVAGAETKKETAGDLAEFSREWANYRKFSPHEDGSDIDALFERDAIERQEAMNFMVSVISYQSDLHTKMQEINEILHTTETEDQAELTNLATNVRQNFSELVQLVADMDMLFKEFNEHFNRVVGSQEFINRSFAKFIHNEQKKK